MPNLRVPNLNTVTLAGRLTRDAELKHLPSGGCVVNFNLAVDDGYRDKATGEWRKQTAFLGVKAFAQLAERCATIRKGAPVLVQGKIVQEVWEKDGKEQRKTLITAQRVDMLEWPEDQPSPNTYQRGETVGAKEETDPETLPDDIPF